MTNRTLLQEMSMKFIDPRIDFAFKKIFGSEDGKDILISFLESLLGLTGNRCLAEITLLDPFLTPRIKELKYSILDVRCCDHRGISYVVEMQVHKVSAFLKRIQYNAAKAYVQQLGDGDEYPELNQVIAITITDFMLFEGFDHPVSRHELRETMTGNTYLHDILHYFIELPKFKKSLEQLSNILDQWIYFLKYCRSLNAIPETIQSPAIRHAFEKAMVAAMSPEELDMYEKAGMAATDLKGMVEQAMEDGIQIGKQRGRQEGRQEGIQIGEQKGRQEGEAAMLLKLLGRKFGQTPDWVDTKVKSASLELIETWSENFVFAHSLDDVFAS